MNFLEEAKRLEELAKKQGLDKKAESILKQKAQEYRQKHEGIKANK